MEIGQNIFNANQLVHGPEMGRKLSLHDGFAAMMSIPIWAAEIQRAGGAAILGQFSQKARSGNLSVSHQKENKSGGPESG